MGKAADAHGKAAGVLLWNLDQLDRYRELGYTVMVDRLGRRLRSRRGARRGAGVQAAAVELSFSTYSAIDGRASNFSRK